MATFSLNFLANGQENIPSMLPWVSPTNWRLRNRTWLRDESSRSRQAAAQCSKLESSILQLFNAWIVIWTVLNFMYYIRPQSDNLRNFIDILGAFLLVNTRYTTKARWCDLRCKTSKFTVATKEHSSVWLSWQNIVMIKCYVITCSLYCIILWNVLIYMCIFMLKFD